ncbi:Glycosyltransferase involved in cell wall bisynthesis [Atopostipes suicloacalis DSM 15692]|uniref:Glycosyltransferase involved in cell wall bisynthesis n=1 Tax=Atopostipes suicloacalis DSM 15692 TaxID=1121025 RepID=A0A1M4X133_9LACT|nr:glycosyltransferase family 4 protein [Atopostipes suicloacalis]SHE87160.1 Glycosyltransferase involved in cell wall bisynthesis [Atopostipes suicloacalis DSM 15692]
MKKILIIAHYSGDLENKDNNRYIYIANLLAKKNYNVELITSDFSHREKKPKNLQYIEKFPFKTTLINEKGYKNNVSIARLISHKIMARNLEKKLSEISKPDLIYCGIPTLNVGKVAAKYAKENNIPFIIDILDLWPEAFQMILGKNILSSLLLLPMTINANEIYRSADGIISVSETYNNRALEVNNKAISKTIYLGTDLDDFDSYTQSNIFADKKTNEIWVAYAGTLGKSYDLITVIDALEIINKKVIKDKEVKLLVMGNGPLENKFKKHAKNKSINAVFTGRLPYNKMAKLLSMSDIAVNPIIKNSAGSIINKHADYAAAGLPVLNTQESLEYRKLVEEYNFGYNCNNGDVIDLANKLQKLIIDDKIRLKMGENSKRFALERFNRRYTYTDIIDVIESLI